MARWCAPQARRPPDRPAPHGAPPALVALAGQQSPPARGDRGGATGDAAHHPAGAGAATSSGRTRQAPRVAPEAGRGGRPPPAGRHRPRPWPWPAPSGPWALGPRRGVCGADYLSTGTRTPALGRPGGPQAAVALLAAVPSTARASSGRRLGPEVEQAGLDGGQRGGQPGVWRWLPEHGPALPLVARGPPHRVPDGRLRRHDPSDGEGARRAPALRHRVGRCGLQTFLNSIRIYNSYRTTPNSGAVVRFPGRPAALRRPAVP